MKSAAGQYKRRAPTGPTPLRCARTQRGDRVRPRLPTGRAFASGPIMSCWFVKRGGMATGSGDGTAVVLGTGVGSGDRVSLRRAKSLGGADAILYFAIHLLAPIMQATSDHAGRG